MFSIFTGDANYFIVLKDGKEYARISKATNNLETIKRFFQINLVEKGGNKDA